MRHLGSLRRLEWSSACRCDFACAVQWSTIQLSELAYQLWAGLSRAAVWETRILASLPLVIEILLTTFWIVLMTLACPALAAACHCPAFRVLSLVPEVALEEAVVAVLMYLSRVVWVLVVVPVLDHQGSVLEGVGF